MRFRQLQQTKHSQMHYKLHKVNKSWVLIGMVGVAVGAGRLHDNSSAKAATLDDVKTSQNVSLSQQNVSDSDAVKTTQAVTVESASYDAYHSVANTINNYQAVVGQHQKVMDSLKDNQTTNSTVAQTDNDSNVSLESRSYQSVVSKSFEKQSNDSSMTNQSVVTTEPVSIESSNSVVISSNQVVLSESSSSLTSRDKFANLTFAQTVSDTDSQSEQSISDAQNPYANALSFRSWDNPDVPQNSVSYIPQNSGAIASGITNWVQSIGNAGWDAVGVDSHGNFINYPYHYGTSLTLYGNSNNQITGLVAIVQSSIPTHNYFAALNNQTGSSLASNISNLQQNNVSSLLATGSLTYMMGFNSGIVLGDGDINHIFNSQAVGEIDFTGVQFSNVGNLNSMFAGDSSLSTVILPSNLDVNSLSANSISSMFAGVSLSSLTIASGFNFTGNLMTTLGLSGLPYQLVNNSAVSLFDYTKGVPASGVTLVSTSVANSVYAQSYQSLMSSLNQIQKSYASLTNANDLKIANTRTNSISSFYDMGSQMIDLTNFLNTASSNASLTSIAQQFASLNTGQSLFNASNTTIVSVVTSLNNVWQATGISLSNTINSLSLNNLSNALITAINQNQPSLADSLMSSANQGLNQLTVMNNQYSVTASQALRPDNKYVGHDMDMYISNSTSLENSLVYHVFQPLMLDYINQTTDSMQNVHVQADLPFEVSLTSVMADLASHGRQLSSSKSRYVNIVSDSLINQSVSQLKQLDASVDLNSVATVIRSADSQIDNLNNLGQSNSLATSSVQAKFSYETSSVVSGSSADSNGSYTYISVVYTPATSNLAQATSALLFRTNTSAVLSNLAVLSSNASVVNQNSLQASVVNSTNTSLLNSFLAESSSQVQVMNTANDLMNRIDSDVFNSYLANYKQLTDSIYPSAVPSMSYTISSASIGSIVNSIKVSLDVNMINQTINTFNSVGSNLPASNTAYSNYLATILNSVAYVGSYADEDIFDSNFDNLLPMMQSVHSQLAVYQNVSQANQSQFNSLNSQINSDSSTFVNASSQYYSLSSLFIDHLNQRDYSFVDTTFNSLTTYQGTLSHVYNDYANLQASFINVNASIANVNSNMNSLSNVLNSASSMVQSELGSISGLLAFNLSSVISLAPTSTATIYPYSYVILPYDFSDAHTSFFASDWSSFINSSMALSNSLNSLNPLVNSISNQMSQYASFYPNNSDLSGFNSLAQAGSNYLATLPDSLNSFNTSAISDSMGFSLGSVAYSKQSSQFISLATFISNAIFNAKFSSANSVLSQLSSLAPSLMALYSGGQLLHNTFDDVIYSQGFQLTYEANVKSNVVDQAGTAKSIFDSLNVSQQQSISAIASQQSSYVSSANSFAGSFATSVDGIKQALAMSQTSMTNLAKQNQSLMAWFNSLMTVYPSDANVLANVNQIQALNSQMNAQANQFSQAQILFGSYQTQITQVNHDLQGVNSLASSFALQANVQAGQLSFSDAKQTLTSLTQNSVQASGDLNSLTQWSNAVNDVQATLIQTSNTMIMANQQLQMLIDKVTTSIRQSMLNSNSVALSQVASLDSQWPSLSSSFNQGLLTASQQATSYQTSVNSLSQIAVNTYDPTIQGSISSIIAQVVQQGSSANSNYQQQAGSFSNAIDTNNGAHTQVDNGSPALSQYQASLNQANFDKSLLLTAPQALPVTSLVDQVNSLTTNLTQFSNMNVNQTSMMVSLVSSASSAIGSLSLQATLSSYKSDFDSASQHNSDLLGQLVFQSTEVTLIKGSMNQVVGGLIFTASSNSSVVNQLNSLVSTHSGNSSLLSAQTSLLAESQLMDSLMADLKQSNQVAISFGVVQSSLWYDGMGTTQGILNPLIKSGQNYVQNGDLYDTQNIFEQVGPYLSQVAQDTSSGVTNQNNLSNTQSQFDSNVSQLKALSYAMSSALTSLAIATSNNDLRNAQSLVDSLYQQHQSLHAQINQQSATMTSHQASLNGTETTVDNASNNFSQVASALNSVATNHGSDSALSTVNQQVNANNNQVNSLTTQLNSLVDSMRAVNRSDTILLIPFSSNSTNNSSDSMSNSVSSSSNNDTNLNQDGRLLSLISNASGAISRSDINNATTNLSSVMPLMNSLSQIATSFSNDHQQFSQGVSQADSLASEINSLINQNQSLANSAMSATSSADVSSANSAIDSLNQHNQNLSSQMNDHVNSINNQQSDLNSTVNSASGISQAANSATDNLNSLNANHVNNASLSATASQVDSNNATINSLQSQLNSLLSSANQTSHQDSDAFNSFKQSNHAISGLTSQAADSLKSNDINGVNHSISAASGVINSLDSLNSIVNSDHQQISQAVIQANSIANGIKSLSSQNQALIDSATNSTHASDIVSAQSFVNSLSQHQQTLIAQTSQQSGAIDSQQNDVNSLVQSLNQVSSQTNQLDSQLGSLVITHSDNVLLSSTNQLVQADKASFDNTNPSLTTLNSEINSLHDRDVAIASQMTSSQASLNALIAQASQAVSQNQIDSANGFLSSANAVTDSLNALHDSLANDAQQVSQMTSQAQSLGTRMSNVASHNQSLAQSAIDSVNAFDVSSANQRLNSLSQHDHSGVSQMSSQVNAINQQQSAFNSVTNSLAPIANNMNQLNSLMNSMLASHHSNQDLNLVNQSVLANNNSINSLINQINGLVNSAQGVNQSDNDASNHVNQQQGSFTNLLSQASSVINQLSMGSANQNLNSADNLVHNFDSAFNQINHDGQQFSQTAGQVNSLVNDLNGLLSSNQSMVNSAISSMSAFDISSANSAMNSLSQQNQSFYQHVMQQNSDINQNQSLISASNGTVSQGVSHFNTLDSVLNSLATTHRADSQLNSLNQQVHSNATLINSLNQQLTSLSNVVQSLDSQDNGVLPSFISNNHSLNDLISQASQALSNSDMVTVNSNLNSANDIMHGLVHTSSGVDNDHQNVNGAVSQYNSVAQQLNSLMHDNQSLASSAIDSTNAFDTSSANSAIDSLNHANQSMHSHAMGENSDINQQQSVAKSMTDSLNPVVNSFNSTTSLLNSMTSNHSSDNQLNSLNRQVDSNANVINSLNGQLNSFANTIQSLQSQDNNALPSFNGHSQSLTNLVSDATKALSSSDMNTVNVKLSSANGELGNVVNGSSGIDNDHQKLSQAMSQFNSLAQAINSLTQSNQALASSAINSTQSSDTSSANSAIDSLNHQQQSLHDQISQHSSGIQSQQSAVNSIVDSLGSHINDNQGLDSLINSLASNHAGNVSLSATVNQVNHDNDQLNSLNSQLNSLRSSAQSLSNHDNDVISQVNHDSLPSLINQASNAMQSHDVSQASQAISNARPLVDSLQNSANQISADHQQINQADSQANSLAKAINSLMNQHQSFANSVIASTKASDINSAQALIDSLNQHNQSLSVQMSQQNSDMNQHQGNLNSIENSVTQHVSSAQGFNSFVAIHGDNDALSQAVSHVNQDTQSLASLTSQLHSVIDSAHGLSGHDNDTFNQFSHSRQSLTDITSNAAQAVSHGDMSQANALLNSGQGTVNGLDSLHHNITNDQQALSQAVSQADSISSLMDSLNAHRQSLINSAIDSTNASDFSSANSAVNSLHQHQQVFSSQFVSDNASNHADNGLDSLNQIVNSFNQSNHGLNEFGSNQFKHINSQVDSNNSALASLVSHFNSLASSANSLNSHDNDLIHQFNAGSNSLNDFNSKATDDLNQHNINHVNNDISAADSLINSLNSMHTHINDDHQQVIQTASQANSIANVINSLNSFNQSLASSAMSATHSAMQSLSSHADTLHSVLSANQQSFSNEQTSLNAISSTAQSFDSQQQHLNASWHALIANHPNDMALSSVADSVKANDQQLNNLMSQLHSVVISAMNINNYNHDAMSQLQQQDSLIDSLVTQASSAIVQSDVVSANSMIESANDTIKNFNGISDSVANGQQQISQAVNHANSMAQLISSLLHVNQNLLSSAIDSTTALDNSLANQKQVSIASALTSVDAQTSQTTSVVDSIGTNLQSFANSMHGVLNSLSSLQASLSASYQVDGFNSLATIGQQFDKLNQSAQSVVNVTHVIASTINSDATMMNSLNDLAQSEALTGQWSLAMSHFDALDNVMSSVNGFETQLSSNLNTMMTFQSQAQPLINQFNALAPSIDGQLHSLVDSITTSSAQRSTFDSLMAQSQSIQAQLQRSQDALFNQQLSAQQQAQSLQAKLQGQLNASIQSVQNNSDSALQASYQAVLESLTQLSQATNDLASSAVKQATQKKASQVNRLKQRAKRLAKTISLYNWKYYGSRDLKRRYPRRYKYRILNLKQLNVKSYKHLINRRVKVLQTVYVHHHFKFTTLKNRQKLNRGRIFKIKGIYIKNHVARFVVGKHRYISANVHFVKVMK